MILVAFSWFVIWALGAATLLAIGYVITAFLQGYSTADALAQIWLFSFNGVVAGAAGYGVVFFLCREKHTLLRALRNVIVVPHAIELEMKIHIRRVTRWPVAHVVAFFLTLVGGYIAYGAGIPLNGFAHVYLTIAVLSFYWVGAYGLTVIMSVLRLFRFIEKFGLRSGDDRISLRSPVRAQDVQTVDMFFVVSSAMSVFAVYVCFRGTLTAFANAPRPFYQALFIPVLFFLPAVLVYSFYPRYVLRQIWEADTFAALEHFSVEMTAEREKDTRVALEYRKLMLDVREKMLAERRSLPLLSFKDAPTLTFALLTAIQLIALNDPVVSQFLGLGGGK